MASKIGQATIAIENNGKFCVKMVFLIEKNQDSLLTRRIISFFFHFVMKNICNCFLFVIVNVIK